MGWGFLGPIRGKDCGPRPPASSPPLQQRHGPRTTNSPSSMVLPLSHWLSHLHATLLTTEHLSPCFTLCPLRRSSLLVFCLTHEHLLPSVPWQRFLDSRIFSSVSNGFGISPLSSDQCPTMLDTSTWITLYFFFLRQERYRLVFFPIINFSQHHSNHKYYKRK